MFTLLRWGTYLPLVLHRQRGTSGQRSAVKVGESLDVRANLIMSDLDSLAPILHTLAQARVVVAAAV